MVEFWGDLGFLLFTLSTLVFTVMYLTLSKAWLKGFIGVVVAILLVGVSILSVYLSLRIWEITVPGVEWVRLVIFWVLGLTMLSSIVGFLEVQFGHRKGKLRRLAKQDDDVKSR
jgi:hypothetical protein